MAESAAAAAAVAGENGREQRRGERGWPSFVRRRWRRKQVICLREDIRKFSSSFSCSRPPMLCSVESKVVERGEDSVVSVMTHIHTALPFFGQRGFEDKSCLICFSIKTGVAFSFGVKLHLHHVPFF